MSLGPRYVPDYRLTLGGQPAPAELRASITSLTHDSGLEGADRVEIGLVNQNLRWLDHDLIRLGKDLKLEIGYADGELQQVFVGEVVAQAASFSGGTPMLTLTAQDRIARMQRGSKNRSFAIPVPCWANFPLPDSAVASIVALENGLVPQPDLVGSALAAILLAAGIAADPKDAQKLVRKQQNESDHAFLSRLARENGWELTINHTGILAGFALRFFSPLSHLDADVTLRYGSSLVEFSPRVSEVGQIASLTARVPVQPLNVTFLVTVGWDWDRSMLTFSAALDIPGPVDPGASDSEELEEALNLYSAPRVLVSELIPRLNERLTASGSTVGDPRIVAGAVLRIEGVGEQFGGLYRVTSATHTLDTGGFTTRFDARKEIWFGSIPLAEQGAVRVGADLAGAGSIAIA
jgi:phage protein D